MSRHVSMTEIDDEQRGQRSKWSECSQLSTDDEWLMESSDISDERNGVEKNCMGCWA